MVIRYRIKIQHASVLTITLLFQAVSFIYIYTKSKQGKDQGSIQSSTTPDPRYHKRKRQKHRKTSHTREPKGQPFSSRSSQGSNERIRQYNEEKTNWAA